MIKPYPNVLWERSCQIMSNPMLSMLLSFNCDHKKVSLPWLLWCASSPQHWPKNPDSAQVPWKKLGHWAIGPWGRKGPCASVKMWVIFRNFSSLKFSFTFFFKKCPSNVPEMVQKFQQSSINRSNRGRRFVQSLQLLRVLVIFEVHHHLKDAPGVSWRKSWIQLLLGRIHYPLASGKHLHN